MRRVRFEDGVFLETFFWRRCFFGDVFWRRCLETLFQREDLFLKKSVVWPEAKLFRGKRLFKISLFGLFFFSHNYFNVL